MRKIVCCICILSMMSMSESIQAQNDYEGIINSLRLNYVVNGREDGQDNNKFTQDSVQYFNAVHDFYAAGKELIPFILKRFDTCTGPSGLIVPFSDPLSSSISVCEIIDCKMGAVMLIDHYLLNDYRTGFTCKEYLIKKNAFQSFKKFYAKCESSSLAEIRLKYVSVFLPRYKK